jgi:hypothetical protein
VRKRIEIDGKFYRKREGKWVEIPPEWVNKTLHPQTRRKRPSKWTAQQRRNIPRHRSRDGAWVSMDYLRKKLEEGE